MTGKVEGWRTDTFQLKLGGALGHEGGKTPRCDAPMVGRCPKTAAGSEQLNRQPDKLRIMCSRRPSFLLFADTGARWIEYDEIKLLTAFGQSGQPVEDVTIDTVMMLSVDTKLGELSRDKAQPMFREVNTQSLSAGGGSSDTESSCVGKGIENT